MKSWLFILIPATALLYYPFSFEEFETPKAYALITFGCFSFFFIQWKEVLKDRVAQALLLFTVSAGVSTILSIDTHMSVFGNPKCPMGLLVIVSYLTVYLASVRVFKRQKNTQQAVEIILSCSFVVAVYAVSQAFGYDFKQWTGMLDDHHYMRPISSLGHPNFMANYLAMTLPLAAWRIDGSRGLRKVVYGAIFLASVFAIFASLSRGMIIAAAIGMAIYFRLTGVTHKKIGLFFSAMMLLFSIGYFTIPTFKETAARRMESIVTPGPARAEYPRGAIRIWKRCPWFGIGTDAFELGFQNQRTPHYWKIEKGGSPHRAHNDFLNVLATQGLFGALAAVLFTITIGVRSFRSRSRLAAPSIAAVAVFYVAGLTSFIIVPTGVLLMIYLAFLRQE